MPKPNILFILSDDHAAHAMSCYGSRVNRTPQMDRIADGGAILTNCFCTNSICTPSRASILTGKYPHVNGSITFNAPDPAHATFPQILRREGYFTSMIGKWHLQCEPTGFDYWNILPGQGRYFDPTFIEMGRMTVREGYVTDVTTDIALDVLENRPDDQPFCMLLHHKAPHDPWEFDDKHAQLFEDGDIPEPENFFDDFETRSEAIRQSTQVIGSERPGQTLYEEETGHIQDPLERRKAQYQIYMKSYLRCVASMDDNIGRVLDYLDESGQADNTIVIYSCDQGFFLGEHGWYDKRFMYEESLRMPFVIRYPKAIDPGTRVEEMILNIDFAPTLLRMAGVDVPEDMQGSDATDLLRDKEISGWRNSMYYRYYYSHFNTPAHWGIRTLDHKLIYYHDSDEWELYDLREDAMEMRNRIDDPEMQETLSHLKAELVRLKEEFDDPESAEEGNARARRVLGNKNPWF
jgi:arylsulfatase A-like enzyme